jgi:hypothetical protein
MSRAGDEFSGPIKQRSGWLVPLAVFFVTACLSALVLAYYFAPTPSQLTQELPAPTDATRPVTLTVGTVHFRTPANYIVRASARLGGDLPAVDMIAMLPNFEGYTLGTARDFTGNEPDSGVVYFSLANTHTALPEQERIDRIYMHQVEDASGAPGPYALRQYAFRADSGYRTEDLFVGAGDAGPVVLICNKLTRDTISPNCLRDLPLANGLTLSYRFKRGHLADWKKIDTGLRALIDRFTMKS